MQRTSKPFTANYLSRQSCTGYSSYIGPSGHSNTLLSSYISRENSSDSTTWGVRLYARENTHAPLSSEWIQLDALWSHSHSCLKTSADIFLQTCHPVLPWGQCCPLKWTQNAVRSEQNGKWVRDGGWNLPSDQKSYEGSATRGLIDGGASSRGLNECHRAIAWWRGCCQHVTCHMIKKEPFSCGWVEHK